MVDKIDVKIEPPHQNCEIGFLTQAVEDYLPLLLEKEKQKNLIVLDNQIARLYPKLLKKIKVPVLKLPAGEEYKNLAAVEKVTLFLQQHYCQRHDVLWVIGGGTIGDLAGFAASIYKRGIQWVYCPTTLLAQVDSSIGGKVAVNTIHGKNILGAFWPPQRVYIFESFLKSLDQRIYQAGLAEIIKLALLGDFSLLTLLKAEAKTKIILQSVQTKLRIIGKDWWEHPLGTRWHLNFGHTIGHALEKAFPFLLHGEAVAIGMVVELFLARYKRKDIYNYQKLQRLLSEFSLPYWLPENFLNNWDVFEKALRQDKKNTRNSICLSIPTLNEGVKKIDFSSEELKKILF